MSNALNLALVIPALAGIVVSFLTELLTKSNAPQAVKSFVSVALSALAGAVSTVIFDQHAHWTVYVGAILTAWLTAIATHYTGVTNVLQDASAGFGLGPTNYAPVHGGVADVSSLGATPALNGSLPLPGDV